MVSKRIIFTGLFCFIVYFLHAQTESGNFKILFYNLENLFDVVDDPYTNDESLTPDGEMHWTISRLNTKISNISKVIVAAGGWTTPDILIFCEVENRFVLEKLVNSTVLNKTDYRIIHKESPDHRGIDIAMLYKDDSFYPIEYQYYPLIVNEEIVETREMLYVKGIVNQMDTIHIFGNHWPSRFSGLLETKELRVAAARLLRDKIEKVQVSNPSSKIVVLGDFNENPGDAPVKRILRAEPLQGEIAEETLYNLSSDWLLPDRGTLKYQSQWFVFDQIMVTGRLLTSQKGIFVRPEDAQMVELPFLFQLDEKFSGKKLFRTYHGFDYQGGFSDHLPIIVNLKTVD